MKTTANDSASQNKLVTVRQIFSAGPAVKGSGPFKASAVFPFVTGGCLSLARKYLCVPRLYQAI